MTLYAAFLSMAPFILLAVTAGAFGPWSADENQEWSYAFLWDVVLVLSVIAGGIVSILVLGEVLGPNEFTQDFVVVAGCVSLALLAEHMLSTVRSRYREHRSDLTADDTPTQP
jgi:drug/metabolite transporter (DMT)-like permease